MKRGVIAPVAIGLALLAAYLAGGYGRSQGWWPFTPPAPEPIPRLLSFPGKQPVTCPPQGPGTAVLLLIGQSSAANHSGQKYRSTHGARVVNYVEGRCYAAESPLLGASGSDGESWTLLGNKLIDAAVFDSVILVPFAIAATSITRWQAGADLNRALVQSLPADYRVTHILWHQGETDFDDGKISGADYKRMFETLVETLRARTDAPIYPCVATKPCDATKWKPDNAIAEAQRSLPNAERRIFAGVDTDALMEYLDRYDGCHFAGTGQEKFAQAWVEILKASRARASQ